MILIRNLLIILEVVSSILLIGIILIQKSKSEGLGGSAFGGAAETLFGARAGNILTKATITLTVIFMANTLALSFFFAGTQERSLIDVAPTVQDVTPAPAPPPAGVGDEFDMDAPLPSVDAGPAADTAPPVVSMPPVETAPPVEPVPAAEVPVPQS